MKHFFVERITDISNELCHHIDQLQSSHNPLIISVLEDLYTYHKGNDHIHPLTNWHAHRLRCMSCIAAKLKNTVKIWECHYLIMEYYYERSKCPCHCKKKHNIGVNHDFFHRDSLNYLVYGSQALANACVYLKPFTNYNYVELLHPTIKFLEPYLDKKVIHIEYVNSELESDKDKPEYGKKWEPSYANTFLSIFKKLKEL